MSLKKRLERLKEQLRADEDVEAVPVIFPGDALPESGSYILINVIDASRNDESATLKECVSHLAEKQSRKKES